MADITKSADLDYDVNSAMRCVKLSELFAGEALADGDACYIKSDGLVWKAVSTVTDVQTLEAGATDPVLNVCKFDGIVKGAKAAGDAVTLLGQGVVFEYGASMTPGAFLWVSGNAGLLSDARVAVNDVAVAKVISDTHILILR